MKGQDGPSFCWKVNINSEVGCGRWAKEGGGKGWTTQSFLNASGPFHIHFCRATQHTQSPIRPQLSFALCLDLGCNSLHQTDDGDLTSSELMHDLYQFHMSCTLIIKRWRTCMRHVLKYSTACIWRWGWKIANQHVTYVWKWIIFTRHQVQQDHEIIYVILQGIIGSKRATGCSNTSEWIMCTSWPQRKPL